MGKRYHRWKKFEKERRKKFVAENRAQRIIGLHAKDFEKLCVLKGVPPTELPDAYRAKFVNKKSRVRTYYERRDISRIFTDDVRETLLDKRVAERKKANLLGRREVTKFRTVSFNEPQYNVDHIILELYPSFRDAIQGLDDTLTTLFIYANLTVGNEDQIESSYKCRQVTIDFMNYVIAARALRKVFITFKGYYYQAEIQGYPVTWIVPHPFQLNSMGATQRGKRIINTSTIFAMSFLQFVNFKLYQSLDLIYPPKIKSYVEKIDKRKLTKKSDTKISLRCMYNEMRGKIASLNAPLLTTSEEETTDELYEMDLLEGVLGSRVGEVTEEYKKTMRQRKLFKGLKFFLGRENNKESLTLVIRAAGGEVSWDKTVSPGNTYSESEPTITHQIMDRPETEEKKYLSRSYLQPQWVYDAFNAGMLLPMEKYFPGATLPPHLSPFDESYGSYEPTERKQMKLLEEGKIPITETLDVDEVQTTSNEVISKKKIPPKMAVTKGRVSRRNLAEEAVSKENENKKLAESMIPRRSAGLYRKLKQKEATADKRTSKLLKARKAFLDSKKLN